MPNGLLPSSHRNTVFRTKQMEQQMTKFFALVAALAVFAPAAYATLFQAAQIVA